MEGQAVAPGLDAGQAVEVVVGGTVLLGERLVELAQDGGFEGRLFGVVRVGYAVGAGQVGVGLLDGFAGELGAQPGAAGCVGCGHQGPFRTPPGSASKGEVMGKRWD